MSIGNSIEDQLDRQIEHHEHHSEAKNLPDTRGYLVLLVPPTREYAIEQVAKLLGQPH